MEAEIRKGRKKKRGGGEDSEEEEEGKEVQEGKLETKGRN